MSALTQELIREVQSAPEAVQREALNFLVFLKARQAVRNEGCEDLLPLAQTAWGPDWNTPEEFDIRNYSMKRITTIEVLGDYRVRLRFDDGVEGTVDLSHLVGKGVFTAWRDYAFFRQAFLTEQGVLTWPGELDLCPDALYLEVTGKAPEELLTNLKTLATHA